MIKFSDKIDQRKLAEYQKEEVIAKMLQIEFNLVSRAKLKGSALSDAFEKAVDYGMNRSFFSAIMWGSAAAGVVSGLAGSFVVPAICLAAAYYSEKQKQKFDELIDEGAEWFRTGVDQSHDEMTP